jgi:hypothetical protein
METISDRKLLFLKSVEPTIRKKIRETLPHTDLSRDDLYQEGRLAALDSLETWKNIGGKSLKTWAGECIENAFKKLRQDARLYAKHHENVNNITLPLDHDGDLGDLIEAFFYHNSSNPPESSLEIFSETDPVNSETLYELLCDEKFDNETMEMFFKKTLRQNLSPVSAAKEMGRTPSRVSQLSKLFENYLTQSKKKEQHNV